MNKIMMAGLLCVMSSGINGMDKLVNPVMDEDATMAAAIQAIQAIRYCSENNAKETTIDVSLLLDEIEQDEKRIAYNKLFDACKQGSITTIDEFIASNPTANLNYQNEHGTTPALHAATWEEWGVVQYLVGKCNADKMMCDRYGQTIFSKAVYCVWGLHGFKKLLNYFSLDEINRACKTMCLKREIDNPAKLNRNIKNKEILYALKDKNNINNPMLDSQTALHIASIHEKIPLIIELLEYGAQCDIKNKWKKTAYDELKTKQAPLFAVREAFNSGSYIPTALICAVLETNVDSDAAHYIKQLCLKAKLSEDSFFESPKARIWKPVCADVCKMLNVDATDEKRCLATVMLLSQHTLTEMNIRLALEDK